MLARVLRQRCLSGSAGFSSASPSTLSSQLHASLSSRFLSPLSNLFSPILTTAHREKRTTYLDHPEKPRFIAPKGWQEGNGAEKGVHNIRREFITSQMVGKRFAVHNGKLYINVKVTSAMVGHRFGEFSPTRKKVIHPKKAGRVRGK
uniref:Ribosomal protein S19 n=1 Tax=Chrysotila carterae TaxID=13221 RepID=A0A7S4BP12_CHRCT